MKAVNLEICVDNNEAAVSSKILNTLRLLGCIVKVENLSSCDYVVSDRCAIERKEVTDLAASLVDGRLFEQAKRLKEDYEKPLLILQGHVPTMSRYSKVSSSSVYGALTSLALDFGICVLPTHDDQSSAQLIQRIAHHEQAKEERPLQVRRGKRSASLQEEQLYFLSGLPHIGTSLATELLDRFETPLKAVEELSRPEVKVSKTGKTKRLEGSLKGVKGMGPVVAHDIKQVLTSSSTST